MSKRIKKYLFRGAIVIILIALVMVAMAPRPVTVDIETVSRGELIVTLDHEGKTRVRNRYTVSAPLAGLYHRITLEPGDPVRANQTVLVTYEPTEPGFLDTRTRAQAQAMVEAAESAVRRARAEYARVEAELAEAMVELRRSEQLDDAGLAPRARLEDAEARVATLRESLAVAEAALEAAQVDVEVARTRLVEPASSEGNSSAGRTMSVRSPISGVVLERLHESEAVRAQGEPLLVLANLTDLEIAADFLSTEAVQMEPGQPTLIDRWGGGEVLRGSIRRIEPSGFMKVSALGVEEQRVNVIVDFDDPEEAWKSLGSEYRVEVRVITYDTDDALLVPMSAVFPNDGGWAVFIAGAETAELRPIEIGERNGTMAEVLSGLSAGEPVIVYPSDDVSDGVLIEDRAASAGS